MKRFMHMRQQSRNYFLSFQDQWVMVFEAGFRVDFVIVFVIVLLSFCVAYILPVHVCGTHDYTWSVHAMLYTYSTILWVIVFFSSLSFYSEWATSMTKGYPSILKLIGGSFLFPLSASNPSPSLAKALGLVWFALCMHTLQLFLKVP